MEWFTNRAGENAKQQTKEKQSLAEKFFQKLFGKRRAVRFRGSQIRAWDPEKPEIGKMKAFGLKAENRLFWPQNREIRVILGGPKIGPETPKSGFPYRPLMAGTRGEMPTGGPGPYLVGTPES